MENILITGASSGTGLGLAGRFIGEGYRVIGSIRTRDKADALQSRLGDRFVPLIFDITKPDEISTAADRLRDQLGITHLSAIINNAGSAKIGPLLHVSTDEFREQLDTLVVGQLTVIQNFYRFLLPNETGHDVGRIINITSISGVGTNYLFGCYAAGKHALEGLTKTLREECEPYGIKVIAVAPGNIATAIWDKQTADLAEKYRDTDYYDSLKQKISRIGSHVVTNAMSVEEFSDAFFRVFNDPREKDRYTIVKSRNKRNPFSQRKVRISRS